MSAELRALAEQKPRRYLTAKQVAYIVFDVVPNTFYHKLPSLRRRGFPKPVPGCGYDPLAIVAWQDMEVVGCFAQKITGKGPGPIDVFDDAALEQQAMERL